MLVVTGDIVATPGHFDELFAAARAHSARSRGEPGCLSHDCFQDPDNPDRIVFLERWADEAALQAHFRTPGIAQLLKAFADHADERGTMQVYQATEVAPPSP
jgi:quinol monooxygenase YgiN